MTDTAAAFSLDHATARYDRGFALELGFEFLEWTPERAVLGMQGARLSAFRRTTLSFQE